MWREWLQMLFLSLFSLFLSICRKFWPPWGSHFVWGNQTANCQTSAFWRRKLHLCCIQYGGKGSETLYPFSAGYVKCTAVCLLFFVALHLDDKMLCIKRGYWSSTQISIGHWKHWHLFVLYLPVDSVSMEKHTNVWRKTEKKLGYLSLFVLFLMKVNMTFLKSVFMTLI